MCCLAAESTRLFFCFFIVFLFWSQGLADTASLHKHTSLFDIRSLPALPCLQQLDQQNKLMKGKAKTKTKAKTKAKGKSGQIGQCLMFLNPSPHHR